MVDVNVVLKELVGRVALLLVGWWCRPSLAAFESYSSSSVFFRRRWPVLPAGRSAFIFSIEQKNTPPRLMRAAHSHEDKYNYNVLLHV